MNQFGLDPYVDGPLLAYVDGPLLARIFAAF